MKAKLERLKKNPEVMFFNVIGIYKDENSYKQGCAYESTFEKNLPSIRNHRYLTVEENGEVIAIFFDKNLLEDEMFMVKLQMILEGNGYSPNTALIRMHKLA